MRQRGDYLIIGLTLFGLAALLLAYLCGGPWPAPVAAPLPVRFQPGPSERGAAAAFATTGQRHWLAAILFVVLILFLIENAVAERGTRGERKERDDLRLHGDRRRHD